MSVSLRSVLFIRSARGFTRRLRRPTTGASHALSGADDPLCRGGGFFAQEVRSGEGRPCFSYGVFSPGCVPCLGADGRVRGVGASIERASVSETYSVFLCHKYLEINKAEIGGFVNKKNQ